MFHRTTTSFAGTLTLSLTTLFSVPAIATAQLRAELVAGGLAQPVAIAQNPANPNIQLVAEQAGRIRVLLNGTLQPTDFLDLSGVVTPGGGERGLLGVAFDPNFATTGRVFVSFTDVAGNSVLARFLRATSDPLVADPASRFDMKWPGGLSSITQPFANHNGGHIVFGPDGHLYYGLGDGGSSDDPFHYAQDPTSLLGKMLRLDVSVDASDPEGYDVPADNPFVAPSSTLPGALAEIWSLGLRNPWRFAFDDPSLGGTGALIIGDVGQGSWEEIDYEPASTGGRNYGWRSREGAHDNLTTLPPASFPLTDPIFEYAHTEGQTIIGGTVYRGSALGASYVGRYFFGDYVRGRIWSLGLNVAEDGSATAVDLVEHTAELGEAAATPSSFGVNSAGELFVVVHGTGRIYRLLPGAGGTGCLPPDPFLALGGGVCSEGGWFPPGYPVPGVPPSGGDPGPTVPPPSSGCSTPDPFAVLGGGTCSDGNWYPPGYPVPATPPPSGDDPPPAPPPSSEGCPTPDPFATLGGGSCVGGEWLPPGYPGAPSAPPDGGGSPPPSEGGCETPDPFEVLGGGTCVGGNWLPPGYPVGWNTLTAPVPATAGTAPAVRAGTAYRA